MGNESTKKQISQNHQYHQKFQSIKVQIISNNNRQDQQSQVSIMHIKHPVQSENKFKDWVKDMENINDSKIKEVILFPLKYSFTSVGLCGSGGIVQLQYEFYEFVLKVQIENRYKLKKNFLQTEIWYLLYCIVQAGAKFEMIKRKIGNIHPNNILINQNGQIKLISTCSIPGQLNNYQQFLQQNQDNNHHQINVYLAPEEINHDLIQKGSYPSHVNPCVAEVFSIGMTVLSCGTLQNCNNLYTNNPCGFKPQGLGVLLRCFKQKYSDYLYQIVSKMVQLIPDNRLKCRAIVDELKNYQEDILDLQPFVPNIKRNFQPLYQNINRNFQNNQVHYLSQQSHYPNPINQPIERNIIQSSKILHQPSNTGMQQQRQVNSVYGNSFKKQAVYPHSRY